MPSSGVVLHAFGADRFDYYALADNCARLVTKFLQLPITLVTDREPSNNLYDRVIIEQSTSTNSRVLRNVNETGEEIVHYKYRNDTRSRSLELSPYDRTILLDSDYIITNSELLKFIATDCDFLCPYEAYDVTNRNKYVNFKYISNTVQQAWATVVVFNKSIRSRSIFAYWQMVQKNYAYYQALMNKPENFRNDYALSLAVHAMNGNQPMTERLPKMMMLPGDSYIEHIDSDLNFIINCEKRAVKLSKVNLHVMNKLCLQSKQIQEDIIAITA